MRLTPTQGCGSRSGAPLSGRLRMILVGKGGKKSAGSPAQAGACEKEKGERQGRGCLPSFVEQGRQFDADQVDREKEKGGRIRCGVDGGGGGDEGGSRAVSNWLRHRAAYKGEGSLLSVNPDGRPGTTFKAGENRLLREGGAGLSFPGRREGSE